MASIKNFFGFGKSQKQEFTQHVGPTFAGAFSRPFYDNIQPNYDLSKPYVDNGRTGYVYYRFGEDNLYPYHLNDMYLSSPMHSSVIKFLTDLLLSSDILFNAKPKTLEEKIRIEQIKAIFNDDFVERFILEYLVHSRVNLKVSGKEVDGKFKLIGLSIVPSEKIRIGKDKDCYYYCEDWRLNLQYHKLEKFDRLNPKNNTIICVQKLGIGQDVYALPQYVSASNWIWLDAQVAYFQKQNIINSINPSAVLTLFQNFNSPEEKQAFVDGLKQNMSSAKNGGKVLILTAKDRDTAPDFQMMDANKLDEAFGDVADAIVSNIARAHQISPVIMGVSTAGKLGATSEIQDAYQIFSAGKLSRLTNLLNSEINALIDLFDVSINFEIKPKSTILNSNNTSNQ